jgi:hypothetical protein
MKIQFDYVELAEFLEGFGLTYTPEPDYTFVVEGDSGTLIIGSVILDEE